MVCTIPASAWTWLVRPRKASVVTMNGAGLDAGQGNPGSVIIFQKRLGVGTATVASSVGRGWCKSLYSGCCRSSVPGNPVALVAYPVVIRFHHARRPCAARPLAPAYLRPTSFPYWVGHIDGPVVRRSDDVTKNSFVINFTRSEMPRNRWRGEATLGDGELYDPHKVVLSGDALLNHQAADQRLVQGHQPYRPTSALPLP
ncbi:hypothetical protein B296_00042164 [Ensete ventricosum]|uniref:Uncharacterized protein n=1 Tax=Ensete ventricosum TaxID=4639 RepID=A0A426XPS9_ENSVE|nr:hypothetical protein B296_00042164 [Ensete ventricosum]